MTNTTSCCERMQYAVEAQEVPIVYNVRFREFSLRVIDGGTSTIELLFCPWCGQPLPGSLRDRWFDELERLGIDPMSEDVPDEFCNGRWYSEHGSIAND